MMFEQSIIITRHNLLELVIKYVKYKTKSYVISELGFFRKGMLPCQLSQSSFQGFFGNAK